MSFVRFKSTHRDGKPTHDNAFVLLEMPHSGTQGLRYRGHRMVDGLPILTARLTRFESDAVRRTVAKGVDAAVPLLSGYPELVRHPQIAGVRFTLARAFVDVNRSKEDVSGLALEGAAEDDHHSGVVWSRTKLSGLKAVELADPKRAAALVRQRCEPMLVRPYTPDEFRHLMAVTYDHYHATVRELHRQCAASRAGVCVHLALHSIAPHSMRKVDGGYVSGPRAKRGKLDLKAGTMPDVILIHNGYKACLPEIVHAVRRAFERHGLLVDDGHGPLLGDNGMTGLYGGKNHVNVLGIEHVTHGGEEPGRNEGVYGVRTALAVRHQRAYFSAVNAVLRLSS